MFLKFVSVLWLVALFTTTVFSLPLDPSSLVRRQKGNPQRETFCTYNVKYCRDNFGGYCKEADPPPWCSVIIDAAPASPVDIDMESNTLVARQDDTPPYELAHALFCEHNAEFCRTNYPQECIGGKDVMPAWCHVSPRRYEPPSNLPPEIYCKYSPGFCRKAFAHLCKAGNEMMPAWCHHESPPTEDPVDDKPSQEGVREMFCKHNAQYCRENFSEDCKPGNGILPEWCHVDQIPTEPLTEGPDDDSPDPPPERIRPMFCKYNVQYCLENFPGDCKAGNESVPVPEWCHAPNPPTTLSSSLPTDSTTLVARQDDNPARQLFCEKNAEYCQEHYPGYCKPGNAKIPSWCHIKPSSTSVSTSGPDLVARQDALGKRTPQDPDREEEEDTEEEREQEQEQKEEQEQEQEEKEEEEEEKPHHFERSWCKKHPHHPYCYSQFCIDNPGRC